MLETQAENRLLLDLDWESYGKLLEALKEGGDCDHLTAPRARQVLAGPSPGV